MEPDRFPEICPFTPIGKLRTSSVVDFSGKCAQDLIGKQPLRLMGDQAIWGDLLPAL